VEGGSRSTKTGTLTRGRPDVTDVIALGDLPADRIVALAGRGGARK